MYSEVMNIYNVEGIETIFHEHSARCPDCDKPFELKVQKPFVYCGECQFIVGLIPERKIICSKCDTPLQLKVHNPFIYCRNCKFLVSLTD